MAIHFQVKLVKFKGKFQGKFLKRSFELRKLRKPLVPEEMSNPAGELRHSDFGRFWIWESVLF